MYLFLLALPCLLVSYVSNMCCIIVIVSILCSPLANSWFMGFSGSCVKTARMTSLLCCFLLFQFKIYKTHHQLLLVTLFTLKYDNVAGFCVRIVAEIFLKTVFPVNCSKKVK